MDNCFCLQSTRQSPGGTTVALHCWRTSRGCWKQTGIQVTIFSNYYRACVHTHMHHMHRLDFPFYTVHSNCFIDYWLWIRFPFIACEIFTCEIDVILKTLVEEEEVWAHSCFLYFFGFAVLITCLIIWLMCLTLTITS